MVLLWNTMHYYGIFAKTKVRECHTLGWEENMGFEVLMWYVVWKQKEELRELKGYAEAEYIQRHEVRQTLVLWWPGSVMQFMHSRTPCLCLWCLCYLLCLMSSTPRSETWTEAKCLVSSPLFLQWNLLSFNSLSNNAFKKTDPVASQQSLDNQS